MRVRLVCFPAIVPAVLASALACSGLVACARDSGAAAGSPDPATLEHPAVALKPPAPGHVPDDLKPSDTEVLVAKAHAKGVQIYACVADASGGTFSWEHQAPDAELTDDAGQHLGRHYVGPTWESTDGSKVVGEVVKKVEAPDGKGSAWLLMKSKGTQGTGVYANVTSIQRVDTVGGKPPSGGCDQSSMGTRQRVPYQANYYFYATRS
jgi:hypothetical protein